MKRTTTGRRPEKAGDREGRDGCLLQVLSANRGEMRAGACDAGHSHAGVWELNVQAEGTGIEHYGGRPFTVHPGDVLLYPAGSSHGTRNASSKSIFQYVLHFRSQPGYWPETSPFLKLHPGRPLLRLNAEGLTWFEQVFHQLWWEATFRQTDSWRATGALLQLLLIGLERRIRGEPASPSALVPDEVIRFVNHLRACVGDPSPLHVAARRLGISYDSLRHRFKQEMGLSPKRFLMGLKIQQAKHLLLTTRQSVKEIADGLGYSDAHHFGAAFYRHVGCSPLHWRRSPRLLHHATGVFP